MIEAIKEIGEYVLKGKGKNIDDPLDILDTLIDDPESDPKKRAYKKILVILIKKVGEKYEYIGVNIEEYDREKINKYLYKQGSPNGTDITPTSRVTTIDSTFKTKILPWFNNYQEISLDKVNLVNDVGKCIKNNKEQILKELKEKHAKIDKKEKAVLTLKIDGKYIGEYDIFKKILVEESKKAFYSKYGKISKAENEICYVCNERKKEVYGFVDTYKFYTVDKPGFVSGGFHQKDAWKVYPVCLNCALILEAGKKYINDHLNFNFYGFNYFLILKFINKEDYENKKEVFKLIEEQHDPKFAKKKINRLTQDENEILELMSEQKNYLNMNFMFYEAPKGLDGSVFNILLYIEDVLPSRLRKLFEIKTGNKEKNIVGVDQMNIFKDCLVPVFDNKTKKKVREKSMEFDFEIVRTFFPKISKNRTYDKYFLDITNKIFTNKPIDYDFLLHFIMQKIRDDFLHDKFITHYPTKISTLKGFMLLNYLNKLNILKINKKNIDTSKMEPNTSNVPDKDILEKKEETQQNIDEFFKEFADFFDSCAKKAIFLEGVLTQFLLDIQYKDRKATPFRTKLKGLKLDEKEIKSLLPEIQNKLEEYRKNHYYKPLEYIISNYFISSGNSWKLTNDEISFYFVLGMNLSNKFKFKKEEENKNGNE